MRAHVARHARQALARRLGTSAATWPRLTGLPNRSIPTCPRKGCLHQPTRRTFITSLLQKPPRDVRETEYEPGWMDIMVWRSRMLDNLKPQPKESLHKAWEQFMVYKWKSHRPLNSTQAAQCRRLLEYFCSRDDYRLPEGHLFLGLRSLSLIRNPSGRAEEFAGPRHAEFAHALLRALRFDPSREWDKQQLERYCLPVMMMLANVGELRAGLTMCPPSRIPLNHFRMISHQVVTTGSEQDLDALLDWDQKTGGKHPMIPGLAVRFYAKQNRVKEVMGWVSNAGERQHNAWDTVAAFAARNGQKAWAKEQYQKLIDGEPQPRYWPHIVASKLWLDEGMRGVAAAMEEMAKHVQPDVGVINRLLAVAREKGDEQLANEITSLAADKGIIPDAYTFLRWLELKVDVSNLEGAKFSLERLQHMSIEDVLARDPQARDQYEDSMNAFLRLAAGQKRPDFPYISELLEQMDEIQVRLEPETVAQLSLKFLENEQFLDVMDLLAIHSFKYGETERQVVQSAFLSFCLDPNVSTQRSWSAYQVLEQYFPDLERPERVKLMDEFFRRRRADMAVKVFGAMRNHRSLAYRPDDSMYRRCFEGLAKNPDLANTQRAYNWLKTDTSIDPSTRLFTALMLAFTAVGRSLTALDFWKEVTACKEGPGYSTLAAVFWALENRPDGAKMAREIWSRIESMDVEVPPDVYDAYAGAIARTGNVLEVQKIIANMASFVGSPASAMTLGITHNALPTRELQKKFEDWAKMRYRDTWAELEKKGRRLNEFQLCHFKIQRPLEAY